MPHPTEANMNDLALMALQAAALFTFDRRGNLLTTNEPDPVRAPRLFLGITNEGYIWRHRDDLPQGVVQRISQLLDETPGLSDPRRLPAMVERLRDALAAHAPVSEVWEGPAWRFPETLPTPAGVAAIDATNVAALREHFPYTAAHLHEEEPCFAMIEEGVAVSVCRSVRITPHVHEAGVETVDAFRGRGYAVRVVAAWARAVRERGVIPLYSTSWENLASRAVARKLGLVQYGIDLSLE